MAGVERLELPTIGFGDRCSTNWNYTPSKFSCTNLVNLSLFGKIKSTTRSEGSLY